MPRKKKSPAQLDREIADVLSGRSRRPAPQPTKSHHATRQAGADVWDVAMDAILEHDSQRAAQIVKQIPGKRATETPEFSKLLKKLPIKYVQSSSS